ncbi:PRC-barrel domain-containing protein [Proteinivorax tanatarense]|uniref:PRC-barrel domain-containing protein n=1 Tax=Proteinivorax tanatarense TaxID=1260629 RepID=A0AAU7VPL0_9FIRM
MKRLSYLMGMPLLAIDKGEKVGELCEGYLNTQEHSIGGFILKKGTIITQPFGVFPNQVNVGESAIVLKEKEQPQVLDLPQHCFPYTKIKEKPIYTKNGENLGNIQDILFLKENGKILGFEVSDGIINDILNGRGIIPVPSSTIYGKDTIVVPNEVIDMANKQLALEDLKIHLENLDKNTSLDNNSWDTVEQY